MPQVTDICSECSRTWCMSCTIVTCAAVLFPQSSVTNGYWRTTTVSEG